MPAASIVIDIATPATLGKNDLIIIFFSAFLATVILWATLYLYDILLHL
jgi:hypothetical protein